MPRPLPTPIADTLRDLRAVGRYLDHKADTTFDGQEHAVARAHAIKVWNAIERVEALAGIVEDCAEVLGTDLSVLDAKH